MSLFYKLVTSPNSYKFSGGDIIKDVNGYRLHIFNSDGIFKAPPGKKIEVLVVAAGGVGSVSPWGGGGGGGGGVLHHSAYKAKIKNTIIVGQGGQGVGQDSFFNELRAFGGGAGGTSTDVNTRAGGSGGGAGHMNPSGAASPSLQTSNGGGIGYGNTGGNSVYSSPYPCGSGGGAGGAGGLMTNGGAGKLFINFDNKYYGGGGGAVNNSGTTTAGGVGGGGNALNAANGQSGLSNTGGGGGGSRAGSLAGSGGSGVVIVAYRLYKNPSYYTDFFNDNSGLAYYKFDGNALEESGMNGTATNVTYSTGKFGQAIKANGVASVSLGIFHFDTPKTISFWAKDNFRLQNGLNGYAFPTFILTPVDFQMYQYNSTVTANIAVNIPMVEAYTSFKHVVVTIEYPNVKIYIDNIHKYSGTMSVNVTSSNYDFGLWDVSAHGGVGTGEIDQLRIFNRALTQTEVTALYNEVP